MCSPDTLGSVIVTNGLGETESEAKKLDVSTAEFKLLTVCSSGCTLPLEVVTNSNNISGKAHATLTLQLGRPNNQLNNGNHELDYAKTFVVSYTAPGWPVQDRTDKIYVTGDYLISQDQSAALPEYIPMMVLYDPRE